MCKKYCEARKCTATAKLTVSWVKNCVLSDKGNENYVSIVSILFLHQKRWKSRRKLPFLVGTIFQTRIFKYLHGEKSAQTALLLPSGWLLMLYPCKLIPTPSVSYKCTAFIQPWMPRSQWAIFNENFTSPDRELSSNLCRYYVNVTICMYFIPNCRIQPGTKWYAENDIIWKQICDQIWFTNPTPIKF